MNTFTYKPKGVCSSSMTFTLEEDRIIEVKIMGGCQGNLLGIANIIKGKTIEEVISSFEGVACGNKKTSCPDQIAHALRQYQQGN